MAAAALSEGAQIINDVSGGTLDAELPHVVADHDCLYVVQHWRGWLVGSKGANPDQDTSVYEHGVLTDVHDELMRQVDGVLAAGVKPERIIIDPGLASPSPGTEHNLPLLTGLETFRATGYPVLIGQSRKRFISAMLTGAGTAGADGPTMAQRDDVTAALSALSAEHGAWAVRSTRCGQKPRRRHRRQHLARIRMIPLAPCFWLLLGLGSPRARGAGAEGD